MKVSKSRLCSRDVQLVLWAVGEARRRPTGDGVESLLSGRVRVDAASASGIATPPAVVGAPAGNKPEFVTEWQRAV